MEMSHRHVGLLLIISMCAVELANGISITGGKEVFSGRLNKFHAHRGPFTRTACQWDQSDSSVMCKGKKLRTVPSNLPQSAMKLNLGTNEITVLLNTSFEHYSNLVILDLKFNHLNKIQAAAFQTLKRLESLDLSGNVELLIPHSAPFHPLESLIFLGLNACHLPDLPIDLMDWFPHLKSLDLSANHLSSLNVSSCKTNRLDYVLLEANRFQELSPEKFMFICPADLIVLALNSISFISEDTIAALHVERLGLGVQSFPAASNIFLNLTIGIAKSSIVWLGFTEMRFRGGIPVGVFRPLRYHQLDILAIDKSGDLSLDKHVFTGLSCKELRFTGNYIIEIEPEYFLGMFHLQTLRLSDNQIMHINPHNTTWENKIENLDLSKNEMFTLVGYQLRGLNNLKSLNLSHNSGLISLHLYLYEGFENLEIIDVTETGITELGLPTGISQLHFADFIHITSLYPFIVGQTFNHTKKLKFLDISHTELNGGSLWDSYFKRSLFQGLINLTELHLSRNPLGNLPDMIFEDNVLLAKLLMDKCKISSLSGTIFQGLVSLVYLDLNGNNFHLISANALKYLSILETLSINDNKIMFVEEGAMENVPLLKDLKMSNNMFVAFNRSTWKTLMNYDLDSIDVSGNPLACQCNYYWLHDLANLSGMFLHQNETVCSVASLSEFRGKPLFEFDPSEYCAPNIVLMSTLPFVALALLIGLMLAFYNRWLIRYKLFLVKLAVIGYTEMQDGREHDEFIFDLNIMFTEEDEMWARDHLRPILEERLPDYDRYSFGDDDLTLGMYYLEAVHYAVEHSFKTILLLSRRAVRDNWFLIKFRTAMDHVHDGLTENTVVIFLEDIPEDEIPYLVRLYLSDRRPYMRWPEDVRGHEYFWNQLTKVVTVNIKYNPMIPPV